MALANYGDLKASVADWLARSDLTTAIPDFVRLTEVDMNRRLRTQDQETSTSLTLTSGAASLPADYLEARAVYVSSSPTRLLRYATPTYLREMYPSDNAGTPAFYTVERGKLKVRPTTSNSIVLVYYQTITALSADGDTNWVLTSYPDAYLFGALSYSAMYTANEERVTNWRALYEAALKQITQDDRRARWSDPEVSVGAFVV